ncbi:MAG: amidohydrolase [Burkholderiales bacterium]|jgi:amidohydrolase
MPSREEMKAAVCREIDGRRDDIIGVAKAILETPEPGFREFKTSKYVDQKLTELGIPHRTGIGLTGIKGSVSGGSAGPSVCVFGELDSLIVPDHPFADKTTGAAHACGHNVQIAMMYACAAAISKSGVLPWLAGKVVFIAVPAEEGIEIEYRYGLYKQGKLHYLTGKPEFIALGELDDVDIAIMTHTTPDPEVKRLATCETNNGVIRKSAQFVGKSAHAGLAPHDGVNALNAAMLAMNAINAQRETFRDADTVRVHPIITKGGDAVNAVPASVRLESYVRAKAAPAMLDANMKVDRSLRAGAMAVGGRVKISTIPGSMPIVPYPELWKIYTPNAIEVVGAASLGNKGHSTGSTDMGDVTQIMPAIHPYCGGVTGTPHGCDYIITDYETALIAPAKAMAMTVIDLLADGAVKAKEVIAKSKSPMTKQQYLSALDSLFKEEDYQG